MSTVSVTVKVQAPPEQLFTHVATLWESGTGLNGEDARAGLLPSARLGQGFRLKCGGHRWSIAADTELVIQDYLESEGWNAVSQPDGALSWTVRVSRLEGGAGLTCVLRYLPDGIRRRLRERLLDHRLRRRALQQLMDGWKADVERKEGLRRLRAVIAPPGNGPPGGPG
jgi:hypothetical protein